MLNPDQFKNVASNTPLGVAVRSHYVLSNKGEEIHDVTESGETYPRHFHVRADGSTYPSNKGPQGQSMKHGCDGTKCGPYTHRALLNIAADLHRFTSDPEYHANEAGEPMTPQKATDIIKGRGNYSISDGPYA